MTNLGETLPLVEVAQRVLGRKMHPNTLTRWRLSGVRGVKLRCLRIGARWHTTTQWFREFLAELNGEKTQPIQRPDAERIAREMGL